MYTITDTIKLNYEWRNWWSRGAVPRGTILEKMLSTEVLYRVLPYLTVFLILMCAIKEVVKRTEGNKSARGTGKGRIKHKSKQDNNN